jgi:uncharacterized protein (DUF2236 family)
MYRQADEFPEPEGGDGATAGPGSLLWRWAGDTRIAFLAGPIGLLQVMHPAIGAALVDHSNFFDDPADRVFRSLPPILGTVYDGPQAQRTGHMVRDFHKHLRGTDHKGRRYHALQPETFWWAHATFQYMVEQVADRFDRHQLTPAEREQLYAEGVAWFRRYGVSDRAVPPTRAAFQREWDRYCAEVLEPNPAADWLLDVVYGRRAPTMTVALPGLPRWTQPVLSNPVLQKLAGPAVRPTIRLLTFGGLPPVVRERFGIPWTRVQHLRLRSMEATVRRAWPVVPEALRWQPRALAGITRARGAGLVA